MLPGENNPDAIAGANLCYDFMNKGVYGIPSICQHLVYPVDAKDNEMVEFADFDISTVRTQMLLLIVSKTDFSQMKRLRNTNCGRVLQERLTRLLLKMPAFASNT